MLKYLGGALGAAALFFASAPAPAEAVCREVKVVGVHIITACADAQARPGQPVTVAPYVSWNCTLVDGAMANDPCWMVGMAPLDIGITGFVPAPEPPPVTVDPTTLTVSVGPGHVGTLWVDGVPTEVDIDRTCIGDPSIC